jgi:hypothetical protein
MTQTQSATPPEEQKKSAPPSDVVWGLEDIGAVINRTEEQAGYLARTGKLGDAVRKFHGTWIGSVRRLRAITF